MSVHIAQSHSEDNHVNATAPCMPCTRIHMHFAQARPPMSCIPLVHILSYLLLRKFGSMRMKVGGGGGGGGGWTKKGK